MSAKREPKGVWMRGLRGPEFQIIYDPLTIDERPRRLCDPVPVRGTTIAEASKEVPMPVDLDD